MGFSTVLKMFVPKDKVFYNLFEEVTTVLQQMGNIFIKAIKEQDFQKRQMLLKSLEEMEHKNDEITHKIFIELGQNFITPFDREDIHALASSLDDIADFIWGSSKRITNYVIADNDDITLGFADVILRCINALHKGVGELRNMKNLRSITESCVLINSLENEADDLLDKAMMHLFSSNTDPLDVIKKKDLYEMLELVTDKCEDAANVIESIIIKYA